MNGWRMRLGKKSKSSWKQNIVLWQKSSHKTHGIQWRQSWVIPAYLKKIETFQINNLTLCLQELKEQQQRQPSASTRKETTNIRAELNDIETKSTILWINESRSWFFEKINKINKPFSRLIKREDPNKPN